MLWYCYYQSVGSSLILVPSPFPKDGYSREPIVHVDPDGDEYEEGIYPFTGLHTNVPGSDRRVELVIERGHTLTQEELNALPKEGYLYRTPILNGDDSKTIYDAVVWFMPLEMED